MTEALALEGRLDVTAVTALHRDLQGRLDQDLDIDLAEVTQLGALCLQCLIAGARALQDKGHNMRLVNVPDQVVAQLKLMGVSPESIEGGAA